ncbi:hypothetical protein B0T26DRAFT_691278 [Lasiosphaeria miniovina]|uniref:WW domain-containing protein n=1 Tax=Lasiosphaeria miniovina TaxID=1954250 RepID=A0AA40BJ87_9PEZI|nr:uncharacterized protein B0T26DRAFT_691278 [Lasiosphaeria miniovina]KAK0735252.1 hypothetical protein B0T26DRAFT_691278 [Lasiosphaeria miniovina]
MSYFNNLTDDFSRFGFAPDRKDERTRDGNYPPPQQYGGGGPNPQAYEGYSAPAPAPSQRPRPHYQPPPDKPPIPTGWVPEWDERYQHWYYVDQATGNSQWEAPGYDHSRSIGNDVHGASQNPGYSSSGAAHPIPGAGYSSISGDHGKNKTKGPGGFLKGAAGGLAIDAVGKAFKSHEQGGSGGSHGSRSHSSGSSDSDSDSDHGGHRRGAPVIAPVPAEYQTEYYQSPPPRDEDIDSSDRESLQEAREEYQEALDDAASSSSSDREEVEEAREEYEEEYEEAYDE